VAKLLEDVGRLRARVDKLDGHFRQAQDDVAQIKTSSDKITARGQKIETLEFDDADAAARAELLRSQGRSLRAVE
jgi:DNA recombination protein RmuC